MKDADKKRLFDMIVMASEVSAKYDDNKIKEKKYTKLFGDVLDWDDFMGLGSFVQIELNCNYEYFRGYINDNYSAADRSEIENFFEYAENTDLLEFKTFKAVLLFDIVLDMIVEEKKTGNVNIKKLAELIENCHYNVTSLDMMFLLASDDLKTLVTLLINKRVDSRVYSQYNLKKISEYTKFKL